MSSMQVSTASLPIKGSLTVLRACTRIISVLMSTASVAGIFARLWIYPTEELRRTFVSNDVVNLCIGVPFLLVSLRLAERGRLAGFLALSGALSFVLYNYLIYALSMPRGIAFWLYLALFLLGACTLAILIARLDISAVRQRSAGRLRGIVTGSIFTALGVLICLRALGSLLQEIPHHRLIGNTECAVDIADLLITPFWMVGGILLILRRATGYLASIALLFQAGMLFIALTMYLALQPLLAGAPTHWADVFLMVGMGSLCCVPLFWLLGGVEPARGD